MGAELVGLVYAGYSSLPGTQFKVLGRMALSALDKPKDGIPQALYFGGWQPLSMALGRDVLHLSNGDSKRQKELIQEVSKICKMLQKAEAIEPVENHPRHKVRQVYRLTLRLAEFTNLKLDDLTNLEVGENDLQRLVNLTNPRNHIRNHE